MAGKKRKVVSKQRKWIITDWCTEEDGDWNKGIERWLALDESKIRYAVWQVESGDGGKPHIQGFIHFQRPIAMTTVKSRLQSKSIHIEKVRDDAAASAYCEKPDDATNTRHYGPVIIGTKPKYGEKGVSPTEALCNMVARGYSDEQLAEEAPWALLRHSRGINALRYAHLRSESRKWREVEVIVLCGHAGTGKTAWAIDTSAEGGYYKPDLSKSSLWYDGYQGERTLILDDFRGTSMKFEELLKVLDGHQLQLPIKGGHTYAMWTRVVITSNTTPDEWYYRLNRYAHNSQFESETETEFKEREIAAFERRITLQVEDITEEAKYPECISLVQAKVDKAKEEPSQKGEQREPTNPDVWRFALGL